MMIDETILQNFSVGAAAAVPIVIAITQVFKFWVTPKFVPFIAMLVGIGVAILLTHDFMKDLSGTILIGILFGLSASGLYSGLKSTGQAIAQERARKAQAERENGTKKDSRK